MDPLAVGATVLWPLALYFGVVAVMAAGIIVLSHLLGGRHKEHATGDPYESGMLSTGSSRMRFSADFYLIAMFFVVFDLESIFIFGWAVAVRQAGWVGFCEVLVFIAILVVGLIYLWRAGALDWGTVLKGRRPASSLDEKED